jgi:hypothetical protein
MAQLFQDTVSPPVRDGSLYMRPFAFGMTAYLLTYHILYLLTRGSFQSPDVVSDVYFFVLATYAGAPELKRWSARQADDPEGWHERIRKGGPLITLWFLLWAGVVLWRIHDSTVPMPPELKTITMQVMGLFFGTYALRQVRKRSVRSVGATLEIDPNAPSVADQICDYIKTHGAATPKAIREAVSLPRRTVTRLLAVLVDQGRLARDGESPQDPSATYRLP